ncbi:hypothetical protein ACWEU6_36120 [Streptosporangium sandarakinum]
MPACGLIEAYVNPAMVEPLLIPELERIGADTASVYDWRPDGPAADPILELRIHLVSDVGDGLLVRAELEPDVNHLRVDKSLMKPDLAVSLSAHATELMRLMR